ncbi:MAG: adenosylcobinamide-GDP ribazoletransferase [Hyphomicrobiales bacterium]
MSSNGRPASVGALIKFPDKVVQIAHKQYPNYENIGTGVTDDNPHKSGTLVDSSSIWEEIKLATSFLTRLPVAQSNARMPSAMRAFPLVGLMLGVFAGALCLALVTLGLSPTMAVVISLAFAVLMTGALHEDALADVADGFGGGDTIERKLEIMKDSRIGTFGVVALILVMILRMVSLSEIAASNFVALEVIVFAWAAAACLSRAFAVSLMATTKNARGSGLAQFAGEPNAKTHIQALLLGLLLSSSFCVYSLGWTPTLAAIFTSFAVFLCVRWLAIRQIGGHTGDVAGTVVILSETTFLTSLSLFM